MKPQPHPNDVLVGANLRLLRQAAHISQTELAAKLGVTFQQVQKYERGSNRLGAGRLLIVANLLKVPVGAFYEGAKGINAPTVAPIQLLGRRDAFRLAEAFNTIDDQRLRSVLVGLVVKLSQR
jgi:transcriptional regulator with XRE-family HTH domain